MRWLSSVLSVYIYFPPGTVYSGENWTTSIICALCFGDHFHTVYSCNIAYMCRALSPGRHQCTLVCRPESARSLFSSNMHVKRYVDDHEMDRDSLVLVQKHDPCRVAERQ